MRLDRKKKPPKKTQNSVGLIICLMYRRKLFAGVATKRGVFAHKNRAEQPVPQQAVLQEKLMCCPFLGAQNSGHRLEYLHTGGSRFLNRP